MELRDHGLSDDDDADDNDGFSAMKRGGGGGGQDGISIGLKGGRRRPRAWREREPLMEERPTAFVPRHASASFLRTATSREMMRESEIL